MSIIMNKKIVLLTLASVYLLSTVIGAQLIVSVAAQEPGVNVGDWALYDVKLSGNTTMLFDACINVTWIKITVQEISVTNITFESLTHYSNGTKETKIYYVVNVGTGQGNGTSYFIAKDLYEGELIYTSPLPWVGPYGISFEGATINKTFSSMYLNASVEVNHLNITKITIYPGVGNITNIWNYYWYKATGKLAELSYCRLAQAVEGPAIWEKVDLMITDVGVIPEFPPALILPLFMIATLAAVWLGKAIWSTKKLTRKPSLCA
jgi:hypothetical protein